MTLIRVADPDGVELDQDQTLSRQTGSDRQETPDPEPNFEKQDISDLLSVLTRTAFREIR